MESHLLQMRGLKLIRCAISRVASVASFTDAWIETTCEPPFRTASNSRIFYRCVD